MSAASFSPGVPVAFVANGLAPADALAAAPVAVQNGGTMLLTKTNEIPAAIIAELRRLAPARIVVLGGTGSVTSLVQYELANGPSTVADTQRILSKFGIPTGPVDGVWGPQVAQGLCTFRQMAGLAVSRGVPTDTDLAKLRQYNERYARLSAIPAATRNGHSTYLLAQETCQTMLYAKNGTYAKVFRISTGRAGYATPNGDYWLGRTYPGWSCSTIFPGDCYNHTDGENALIPWGTGLFSQYGHMYNKRSFKGSYMLHGSSSVPTYPASHGCVRVTVATSDWLYHNLDNGWNAIAISVVGSYW